MIGPWVRLVFHFGFSETRLLRGYPSEISFNKAFKILNIENVIPIFGSVL